MPANQFQTVIQSLRRFACNDAREPADGQLLRLFLSARDESAFAALVQRHGPMVLRVCLRVLVNRQDAEDAFQATFLVLARKAASVTPPDLVGNWLYGVAYRTALETRARACRQYSREKQVAAMPHPSVDNDFDNQELRQLLDQELSRLSDKYRVPIVLCELEGRSRKDVAALLKIPEGTLSSRLATARKMLALHLTARGWTLSAGLVASFLAQEAANAAVTPTLAASAAKTVGMIDLSTKVIAIAEGVIKTMLLKKLKSVASCVLALCLASGSLAVVWSLAVSPDGNAGQTTAKTDTQTNEKRDTQTNQTDQPAAPKKDADKKDDKKDALPAYTKIEIKNGKVLIRQAGKEAVEFKNHSEFGPRATALPKDGTLYVDAPIPDMEFVLDVKELTHLKVNGVAKVEVVDLKGKTLKVEVVNVGQVVLKGSVDEQTIQIKSAGQVDARDCRGKKGSVQVGPGGRALVHITHQLWATAAAGGQIEYVGTPKVEVDASKGGRIFQSDAEKADSPPVAPKEKEQPKEQPPAKGALTVTAEVDGFTQGTMFNTQKYPFKYTGTSSLDVDQLKSLAKAGDVPAATTKALLACLLWPKTDDTLEKATLKSDGKKLTGEVEVKHKYGKQGTHMLKLRLEGTIEDNHVSLNAVNPVVTGGWDWGGGAIKLGGEVKISILAK